ncbi:hypothetical protein D2E25_1741 [Bifidobacterium goeldii]|uniref:Uncharacterized protein n=1 Tax=Bifidobacterium goeldii TaxID=2306975 RepID=A0A430FFZ9_9BIFI|nr:hypothetical protein [Bifidobacterium goeldii]RSX51766.1 hypothetical protein D2E25_1741 [Bifidobacterium goeldii]
MHDDGSHVLFVCEGSAEKAIIETLIESGKIGVPLDRIEEDPEAGTLYTTKRSGAAITDTFLNFDYGGRPLLIIRIIDSQNERFNLRKGYERRAIVKTLLTRPEIEILVILREQAYKHWQKSNMTPSRFCKEKLGMSDIKRYEFIKDYWSSNPDELCNAILEYQRIHNFKDKELCLAELLNQ